MSSSIHPESEQQSSREIKPEESPVQHPTSGSAEQDPPVDAKQGISADQPAPSEPDSHSKSKQDEPTSTENPQEAHPEPVAEKGKSSITELASSAATTATTAALGMKDNVFSMFGGGAKKEKKEPTDDPEEASGSAKAQKEAGAEAEAAAAGEVSLWPNAKFACIRPDPHIAHRTTRQSPRMYILNPCIF